MPVRRFLILSLMIVGIATFTWFLVPPPSAVKAVPPSEGPWKLLAQQSLNTKDAIATLESVNLWGKLADLTQPIESEPAWRFIGAMARGQARHVIIQKDNQQELTLVPGDSLPGGSKILSIENDRLCLLINGQKRSLYIYPQGPLGRKMSDRAGEAPIRRVVIPAK